MNELSVIGYLCYVQKTLGSSGGKHCDLLKKNVQRKVFGRPKAISGRNQRAFDVVLSQIDLGNVDTWKMLIIV